MVGKERMKKTAGIGLFVCACMVFVPVAASAQRSGYYTNDGRFAKDQAAAQRGYERQQKAKRSGDMAAYQDAYQRFEEESTGHYRGFEDGAQGIRRAGELPPTRRRSLPTAAEELYSGIIPGKRDRLGSKEQNQQQTSSTQSGAATIDWIGFLPEKERTRVFVQASEGTQYTMDRSEDGTQLVFTFEGAKVKNRNLLRFIDTSFFKRSIQRIETSRKSGDIILTLTIEPGATPNVTREGGYIYFDFAHEAEDNS